MCCNLTSLGMEEALNVISWCSLDLGTSGEAIHASGGQSVGNCYVPVSQVNPVSVSVRPVTFPQMRTVVRDVTKHTPPCFPPDFIFCYFPHNPSPSLPFTSARLMSMDFVTTPRYLMDSAFSEWSHTELLPRWLISPHACFTYHAVFRFYYFFILRGSFP